MPAKSQGHITAEFTPNRQPRQTHEVTGQLRFKHNGVMVFGLLVFAFFVALNSQRPYDPMP
jgi:hypothetical protein